MDSNIGNNRKTPVKRLGIIFRDRLSVNMFVDFLKSIYLEGHDLTILSYTLFNTVEYAEFELVKLPKVLLPLETTLILIKGPEVINEENPVLVESKDKLDQLVVLDPRDFPNPKVLKGSESLEPILTRWKENLERMAKEKLI